jgi:hypothetical protein
LLLTLLMPLLADTPLAITPHWCHYYAIIFHWHYRCCHWHDIDADAMLTLRHYWALILPLLLHYCHWLRHSHYYWYIFHYWYFHYCHYWLDYWCHYITLTLLPWYYFRHYIIYIHYWLFSFRHYWCH